MRRTAKVQRPQKMVVSQGVPLPAPVGGWDAISPLANMPVDRAVQLDNWVCRPGWIEPRKGYIPFATGVGSSKDPVQSVMAYNGLDGSSFLFACAAGTIYDCTNGGAAVPTTATGLQSSRLQHVMFANASNQSYLMTCNGADAPWSYDGTTWAQRPIVIGYAAGSITWSQNFIVGETINLNGSVITFVSGAAYGNQVSINDTLAGSLNNLLSFLQSSGDPNVIKFTYATELGTTLQLTSRISGTAGNSLTFQAGYATGTITFAVNPSNGDTISLNGTAVEFLNNVTSFATGTILFSANPSNGDTIVLDGAVVEFVTTSPTGNQVAIGGSLSATLSNLLTVLNASTTPGITNFTFTTGGGNTLILTAAKVGASGNLLTISASNATTSGPTLTGGSSGVSGPYQVAIQSTLADTLSSALGVLNNSNDANINSFTYAVSGDVLKIQAADAGVLGNSLTIAASAATASGTTLVGGSTAAASGTNLTNGGDDYGITSSDFITVTSFQNRLWFVPVNSTNVVYLQTVGGIQGSGSVFPLGQLMRRGGYIQAIGTWTVDTRQNVDEYIAFITSRGEVIVYAGTDPTTANTFSLTGIYQIGAPVGRRCCLRITGDLQIITVDGVVGMSEMLSTDRAAANRVSLTSIIMNQMASAAQQYKNNFGWQLIEYPLGTLAILNIPVQENQQQMQFVMNTITGAWSRFIGIDTTGAVNNSYGINANCWEVNAADQIFFGGNNGTVYQWGVGSGDDTQPITALVKGAFNSFGNASQLKRYAMLQPLITTTGNPIPSIGIDVDFSSTTTLSTEQPIINSGPQWGLFKWGEANWGAAPTTTNNWISVVGLGHYVSIVTQVSTYPNLNNRSASTVLQLNGWNIIAESGAFV
jgi:hypothetical protein